MAKSISELAAPIDATDIVLNADALGLGQPWSPSNPALEADAGEGNSRMPASGGGSPDLMTLLGSAMQPPDPAVAGQFTAQKQRELDTFSRQQATNDRRYEEDRRVMQQAFSAENAMINDTPKWDVASEREKYKSDPIEAFGSFASVFAMVASAFTRAPMENALNGAAAAINAKRENNEFEYNRAFDAWKTNTDLAVKRFNMQHTALQDAFTILDKDTSRGNAKLLETMTKFGMEKELLLYQNGMVPEIMKSQESQAKMIEGVVRTQAEVSRARDQERRTDIMAKRASLSATEAQTVDQLAAKYENERLAAGLEPDPAGSQLKALEEVNKTKSKGTGAGNLSVEEAKIVRDRTAQLEQERVAQGLQPDPTGSQLKALEEVTKATSKNKKPEGDLGTYKGTEAQNKNLMFATMADRALTNIERVKQENNYKPSPKDLIAFELMEGARRTGGGVNLYGMIANYVLSPSAQQYYQAAREFTAGVLRKETGAAFAQNELTNTITRYIDSPGDSPALEAQKEEARAGERKMMWMSTGLPSTAWSMDAAEAVLSGKKPPASKEKPLAVPVGASTKADREGQTYERDGWLWEKRGDKIVPLNPKAD